MTTKGRDRESSELSPTGRARSGALSADSPSTEGSTRPEAQASPGRGATETAVDPTTDAAAEPQGDRRRTGRVHETTFDDLVGAVVRLMPDAAVVVDQTGRIVAANALAETLFGFSPGGLSGEFVDDLVPERFRVGHGDHRTAYTTHPTQRPMGAGLELWARRRDGSEFPVDISLAPLGVPERPLTLAAVRDLTQRRAEWAALGRLAAIVSASDDAIVSMDLKGTVTSWNPAAQRLLGYKPEEIVGRPIFRLVPPERRSEVEEQLGRMRAGMRMSTRDTRRLRKNGDEIDVSESMSLIREPSGEPVGFTWLMRDIAERKRTETESRRLLVETQRRERWLEAISEIRLVLLGGGTLNTWLELIARRVCELADTETSAILLESLPGVLEVVAFEGEPVSSLEHSEILVEDSMFGSVIASGKMLSSRDPSKTVATDIRGGRSASFDASFGSSADPVSDTTVDDPPGTENAWGTDRLGPFVVAPLTTSEGSGGVLLAVRTLGRTEFDTEDVRLVESLAQQAGLAIEIARAQSDREQLALIADRERIARDLHDHVIQRLFAVGMALQAAAHSINDTRALERINDSVEELDATIRDVRSTIFSLELRATERAETSTRSRVLDVASMAADGLGFQPRLQFDGPVDTRVPEEMVPDVLAVVRETLSNTARHAGASTVEVRLQVHDDLVIVVSDDGRGADGATRSSGLANLRARAERRGGWMSIGSNGGRGTRIEWRVPLPLP